MSRMRIVVKIGSSSLTNQHGGLSQDKLIEHVNAIAQLKKKGHDVVLISSGAVAAGFQGLGYPSRPVTIAGKQAAAAVGQGLLMQGYNEAFQQHNLVVAQLLLTRNDFSNHEQYTNAYATIQELLKRNIVPIVNENDSTSIAELTFGDNDMLSALVSGLIHANTLIILTDINGIYSENPNKNPKATKYDIIEDITDEMLRGTDSEGSKLGTGGMKSKLEAANMALSLGVPTFIGKGNGNMKLLQILEGKGDGTYIGRYGQKSMTNKKQWLAFHSSIKGKIYIDNGAVDAVLKKQKSILPVGIKQIEGVFEEGDVVEVLNLTGKVIGKGQVNYSSDELNHLKGKNSKELLKEHFIINKAAIHRDQYINTFN